MSKYQLNISNFAPKFQVEGVTPTNHSSPQKTRLNDLSYGIKNLNRSFFCFVTIHAFDRQTDGQTPFSSLVHTGIPCSTEIMLTYLCLSIMWMMHRVRIEALELLRRKENHAFVSADL